MIRATEHVDVVRERLPNRRGRELINFERDGFADIDGVGRLLDSRVAEVFPNVAKTGQAIEAHARDAAIVASVALQHRVLPDTIRYARNEYGTASGPLGTLLDLLAKVAL